MLHDREYNKENSRSNMRLVQTQLVAYRLGMERQLNKRKASSVNDEERTFSKPRSNSMCKQNSQKRTCFFALREKQKESPCLDDWQLTALRWIVWAVLFGIFIEMEFGTVFFILSVFYFIYLSLRYSRRKPGEPSAYSVYNKNCEAIEGSLTAEQFERELRYKPLS